MLAQCRFMENISVFKDVFDEDEKTYLKGCSLPAAMKATPGGLKILSNHEAKKWIKSYYFAITSHEIIKFNVKAYRGLTLGNMRELSTKRGEASEWFKFYPREVAKNTVAQLKQALLIDSQGIHHEEFFKNHLMQTYYERYVNLAEEFRLLDNKQLAVDKDGVPYRREQAYLDSLQSNLQSFINSAN